MSKSNKTTTISPKNLPISFKITSAFRGELEGLEVPETDLFVMTHLEHTSFGHGAVVADGLTDGHVVAACKKANFKGKAGECLVIEVPDNPIKNVLMIGLGKPLDVHRTTICSMYRMIIDSATSTGAKKITIPFFSGLLFDVNYRGMLAVLNCRIGERARTTGLAQLEEIEILCTPQAKRHIVDGLSVDKQLCAVCRDPKFKTGEQ